MRAVIIRKIKGGEMDLQYNRKLCISIAGSRKAARWPRTDLLWSEFLDRLRTPVRSQEPLREYLSQSQAG